MRLRFSGRRAWAGPLAVAAGAWLLLLLAAPVLPPLAAVLVYATGSVVCHQLPERSFHVAGAQLAVCARCTGIYAGAAVGAILGFASLGAPYVRATRSVRWLLGLAALPTAATVGLEWLGLWDASNLVRAVAGLPMGWAAALVATRALR